MKQFILPTILLLGFAVRGLAQDCTPDATGIPDTAFGVFPLPFITETRPEGGIPDTACVNKDFEFTFNIKVGGTLNIAGTSAEVQKVSFPSNGTAVTYEPQNGVTALKDFSYVCNPPNCVFEANKIGCVKIYGKPTLVSQIGRHNMKIKGAITVLTFVGPIDIPVEFPTDAAPELAGNYYLFVQDPSSNHCTGANSAFSAYAPDIELNNRPNPFSEYTQIYVTSREQGNYELRVVDMLGQTVRRQRVNLHLGENIIDFDGRDLANGLYVYTLSDGRGGVSGKMVVNHGRR